MFDRIRKAFAKEARPGGEAAVADSEAVHSPVSEWAAEHGFAVSSQRGQAHSFVLDGVVGGKPWRMELGPPTRNFIHGAEVRGRADLGLSDDITVLVMNRALKEALERKAYSVITNQTQTKAEPTLPEEMRWLAMYDEVGWEGLPALFWTRYAVMAHRREHAVAWIDAALAQDMLDWPIPAPGAEVPFMVLLMRGRAYMRMELSPHEVSTLQHAALVFTTACEAAVGAFTGHMDI